MYSMTEEKEGIFMKRKNQKTFKLLAMVLSVAFIVGTLTNPAYAYQEKQTSPESGHTALAAASSSLLSASSVRTSIATATVTGIKDKAWTGKRIRQKPKVSVSGYSLTEGSDYTIKYSHNKNVGKAKMVITGKGIYKGSITKHFFIYPKATKITSIRRSGSKMTIKWKKVDHQVSGYQIAYTAAKRQGAKIRYADITEIKDRNRTSKTMRITSTYVRYMVWIRVYKKTGGKTYYSEWSDYVEAWRD